MSRIGKKPVLIPSGVEIKIDSQKVTIKGPKGELNHNVNDCLDVQYADNQIVLLPKNSERTTRALWGLNRTLIENMVIGVTKEFQKSLEIIGVGYRCQIVGKLLKLELGFSHPVEMKIPEGVTITQNEKNKNIITITSKDKQVVGQFCARIRKWRPPEPYKGKGIKYVGEQIQRKAGKSASK